MFSYPSLFFRLQILGLALVAVLVSICMVGCSTPKLTTHTRYLPSAKVTVVHLFSPSCGPCQMMHDDWVSFEFKSKNIAKIVVIDMADKDSPEFKQFKAVRDAADGAVPFTAWLDSEGKILAQQGGAIDQKLLSDETVMLDRKLRKKS